MMLDKLLDFTKWGEHPMNDALPKLGANKNLSTTSGLSSGAYMAVQMHVAYSDVFKGAGVFAGGPYDCAQGKEMTALTSCMSSPTGIDEPTLENITKQYADSKSIADPSNIKDHPVFLFSGTMDYTVFRGVVDKLETYYTDFGADVAYEKNIVASHTMPTDLERNTNACTLLKSPFIANCNYDGAGEMFKKIIPNQDKHPLKDRDLDYAKHGELFPFDQTEFTGNGDYSMDDTGYVYVPNGCKDGKHKCQIHVAFHGCQQGKTYIDDTYVKDAGYLEWAGTNNIITLFPQATKQMLKNPQGCWDWWGYAGSNYAQQDGPQMKAVMAMIDRLHEAPAAPHHSLSPFGSFGSFGLSTLQAPDFSAPSLMPSFGLEELNSMFMMLTSLFFYFFKF